MRSVHATEIAVPEPAAEVRPKTLGRTLNARRVAAAPVASRCLRDGIRAAGSSYGEVARALGVDPSRVADLADEEHDAGVALRDILAMPRSVARAVLAAALDALDEAPAAAPAERASLLASGAVGRLAHNTAIAMADGVLDDAERALLARDACDAEGLCHAVLVAMRGER